MLQSEKTKILAQFKQIPGVGSSVAEDLWQLGIRSIRDLRGRNPETLYLKHCRQQGGPVDRCMLYVFRCAVYYANTAPEKRDPELLKWWNWKGKN